MTLNFVCICLQYSHLHIVFTNEKGELSILTTKHGLLANCTKRKVCHLTTKYGHTGFAELQTGKFIFWPQIWGSSWAFLELCPFILFPNEKGFSYLFSKASGSNYMQLKSYTLWILLWIRDVNTWLPLLWGSQICEQIRPKNFQYKLD